MKQDPLLLPNPTDWLTLAAAAFLLGVSRRTVGRMIEKGTLTGYRPYGAPLETAPHMLWRPEVNAAVDAMIVLKQTQAR